MSNNCFDPLTEKATTDLAADLLADPFRRRLLSAAVLSATGAGLVAAGIPMPSLAASSGRAAGALLPFGGLPASLKGK